jgi:hypothetical protein
MARPRTVNDDPDDNEETDRRLGIVALPKDKEADEQGPDFPIEPEEPDEGRDFAKRKKRGEPAVASTRLRNY